MRHGRLVDSAADASLRLTARTASPSAASTTLARLALPHLTKDDAPAGLFYASQLDTPITSQGIGIHHLRFGQALKEKMDELGIECEVHTGMPRGGEWTKLTVDFVKKHLGVE